jgi:hypothetical protein
VYAYTYGKDKSHFNRSVNNKKMMMMNEEEEEEIGNHVQ